MLQSHCFGCPTWTDTQIHFCTAKCFYADRREVGPSNASDWDAFAQSWIAELRGAPTDSENGVGQSVVMMNFTARPEHQWQFILAAIELGHIAAGPIENLLGKHGEKYIEKVEQRAQVDPKFGQMLAGVWKYLMTDKVWARIEALKAKYPASPK